MELDDGESLYHTIMRTLMSKRDCKYHAANYRYLIDRMSSILFANDDELIMWYTESMASLSWD